MVSFDFGLYINIFEVEVPSESVNVMVTTTTNYPNLQLLREEIKQNSWNCRVYSVQNRIFGYGEGCSVLKTKSFHAEHIRLHDEPSFCAHLILEGLAERSAGYRNGRLMLYDPKPYCSIAGGKLQVYRGYDLRSIWWRQEREARFGIVIDVRWKVQDEKGKHLSTPEIAAYNATMEIGQIQEEFLPNGKINTEVARLRLQNHILPWVEKHSSFSLPCGVEATITKMPVRVVMGA